MHRSNSTFRSFGTNRPINSTAGISIGTEALKSVRLSRGFLDFPPGRCRESRHCRFIPAKCCLDVREFFRSFSVHGVPWSCLSEVRGTRRFGLIEYNGTCRISRKVVLLHLTLLDVHFQNASSAAKFNGEWNKNTSAVVNKIFNRFQRQFQ